MYIYCSWNYETGTASVKFADLPECNKSLDFLSDCMIEIAEEFNRQVRIVHPQIKQDE